MTWIEREKAKAIERNQALWDYYNKQGRLLLGDFKRITGGQYQTVTTTFESHDLKAPPVYDSRQEKYKRKAKLLRDEARRLDQGFLTIRQVAKVLKTKYSRVVAIEGQLLRAGCSLPDIITEGEMPIMQEPDNRQIANEFGSSIHDTLHYPAGFQVMQWWIGPTEDEITYLLK